MKKIAFLFSLFFVLAAFNSNASCLNARAFYKKIDASKAIHKIQLGTYSDVIPVKIVELMRQLGSVTPIADENGSTYYTAAFESEELAQNQLPKLQSMGFNHAVHVVQYGEKIYDIKTFKQIANGQEVGEGNEDIKFWE